MTVYVNQTGALLTGDALRVSARSCTSSVPCQAAKVSLQQRRLSALLEEAGWNTLSHMFAQSFSEMNIGSRLVGSHRNASASGRSSRLSS